MHRVAGRLVTSQLYSGAGESFALLIVVATTNTERLGGWIYFCQPVSISLIFAHVLLKIVQNLLLQCFNDALITFISTEML